ncbi:class I adenylate-forming enzyme family protein [Actinomycetospora aeridis]|uniref:AMP-binding protein n=1 Tax=Actinomycetospora aeridis TaxID=3129231 RepID=A0ABU8NE51_9PSEU
MVQRNVRMADWVRIHARNSPHRPCLVTDEGVRSFGEVDRRVNRLAGELARLGVGKGDRVALFATDRPEYVETLLACLALGAVYVPLNFRLARPELQTLLTTAQARVLFFSDRYADMVRALDVPGLVATVGYDSDAGDHAYDDLVARGEDRAIDVEVDDADTVCLAFTSGTTALPKAVVHSQRMVKHLVTQCLVDRRMTSTTCHYTASPLFHVGGMNYVLAGIARGHASLILPAFDPSTVARWMASGELSDVFLVPTMISMLLEEEAVRTGDFSALRSIGYGGAPMSPALLRRAMAVFDCDFLNMFGSTEGGCSATLGPEDHRLALAGREHLLGSIGRAVTGVDLRVCDDDLREVADGEVGELVFRADATMDGYLGRPDATAEVLVDGRLRTGDLAHRDADGYLYLAGRRKDMIIRGGENVYPLEIEDVLTEHPACREVAVVGVPDDHWGEIVRAHVVVGDGARFDEDDVRAWCRSRLAGFKVPALFVVADALPRNAGGKVLKRELRRQP